MIRSDMGRFHEDYWPLGGQYHPIFDGNPEKNRCYFCKYYMRSSYGMCCEKQHTETYDFVFGKVVHTYHELHWMHHPYQYCNIDSWEPAYPNPVKEYNVRSCVKCIYFIEGTLHCLGSNHEQAYPACTAQVYTFKTTDHITGEERRRLERGHTDLRNYAITIQVFGYCGEFNGSGNCPYHASHREPKPKQCCVSHPINSWFNFWNIFR